MKYGTCPRTLICQPSSWTRWWWLLHNRIPLSRSVVAAVGVPPADVVRFGVGRRVRATRPGAPAVPFGQRPPLRGAEQPTGAAEVEDFAVRAEDDGDDAGVGGHPPYGAGADRGGDPVDLRRCRPRCAVRPGRSGRCTVTGGNPSTAVRSQPAACRNTSTAASERSWARATGLRVLVRVGFGPRNTIARVVAEPHPAQVSGDDRVDGRHDVAGGFRVEEPVDPGHPIRRGGDGQGAPAALPGLPRFDAVLIQPVPDLPGEGAQFRHGQGGGVLDQDPFRTVQVLERAPVGGFGQFTDDHRRLLHRHPAGRAARRRSARVARPRPGR